MTTTFRHGTYKDRQNTSYMGSYTTDYNTLCEVFGEPTHLDTSSDGKIKAEWVLKFNDGNVATIYDYKEKELPLYEYDWHIGGRNKKIVEYVSDYIENNKKQLGLFDK